MKKIVKHIYCGWYYFCTILSFIILYPYLWMVARQPEKNYNRIVRLRRRFSLRASYLAGIRYRVEQQTAIDWSQPYVICPNHSSVLDITAINYLCPQPFSFMGKEELLHNPLTRIFFKTVDIPVNRSQKIAAFRAYKKAESLLQKGKSLVIFPEGKIDDIYPPKLQEFKAGAFKMAIDNQIAILPVVIHNAWELLFDDGQKYGAKPGSVKITVLEPISTQGLSKDDQERIAAEIYEKMFHCWKSKIK